jgi:hypothetical protein
MAIDGLRDAMMLVAFFSLITRAQCTKVYL